MERPELKVRLHKHRAFLHTLPNVTTVGIGYKRKGGKKTDELSIVCGVEKKLPLGIIPPEHVVPKEIDGAKTDVVETGVIHALARTDRVRPAPGGVSIGHFNITAGTLGAVVRNVNGESLILSNNHVLADSNNGAIGDPIYQPGPVDGGTANDTIAELEDFVPINFIGFEPPSDCKFASLVLKVLNWGCEVINSRTRYRAVRPQAGTNTVDCAIARPLRSQDVSSMILDIGMPIGVADAPVGTAVKKSGRTTELTEGEILQTDVSVTVQYGAGKMATFEDQLMAGAMSQGGDSGSLVCDSSNRAVGLLFAGSDTTTIINRISNVLQALSLRIP